MFWIFFVDIGETLIPAVLLLQSSMLCTLEHSAASDASDDVELIEVAEGISTKPYCDVNGCGSIVDCSTQLNIV